MRRLALLVAAVLLGSGALGPALAGNARDAGPTKRLASPYDGWRVDVRRAGKDPRVLRVSFDSKVLSRRAVSTVFLPDAYFRSRADLPVLYFLHGVVNFQGFPAQELTDQEFLLRQARDAELQVDLMEFPRSLARQRFVVVAPDTAPGSTWCQTCFWSDGKDGAGVQADTHLHRELLPLVQSLFHVRRDRGGRGVMGHSMGGWGALLQAMRHPDVFGVVAALSPLSDYLNDPVFVPFGPSYLRTQGYGEYPVDEPWYREHNPVDAARNLVGSGVRVVLAVGDGCLGSAAQPECAGEPKDSTTVLEYLLRENNDAATNRMRELGLSVTYLTPAGSHGRFNARLYRDALLPLVEESFARPGPLPRQVSFRTTRRAFSAWGYAVSLARAETAYTGLLDARTDGRSFTLAGVGRADVTTPPAFVPSRSYRVRLRPVGGVAQTLVVKADGTGRLRLRGLVLGAERGTDERSALVSLGLTPVPQITVEVLA